MSLTAKKLWNQLRDPVERKKIWDILFYRDWGTPLTQWPHVNRFAMYVRRDVAALLWDFGPEVATAEVELPEDEYVEKYARVDSLRIIGSSGSSTGQLNRPKGIALDDERNVYVADSNNHRLEVFTREGKFVRQWGGQGNLPGQFQEPWSVAVDSREGVVYVADTWNHRIQKFDLEGQFITSWGSFGDTAGQAVGSGHSLYGPRDVALDGEGNLWVADTGNKRVLKFDPVGTLLGQWGGAGDAPGQFLEPVGIAIDVQGNIYVADTWNQRIQKFAPDFTPISQWPVVGWESTSVVNKPYLAADLVGNLYATDPENYRVLKFDQKGELLKVWGQYGSDASSLNLPTGIAVDIAAEVFVADSENSRLVVFPPVD
jgi:DNA-binding beta-propeller fold protein YncE